MARPEQRRDRAGPPGLGVGAVLAAGAGSRYRGPTAKVLALLPDRSTLVGRALNAATVAGLDAVAVVLGELTAPDLAPLPAGVIVLDNPRWSEGQATSLAVAVAWARARHAPALTIGLGDQPDLRPEAWRNVAACPSPLAVATYGRRRGHPVRLGAQMWDALPSAGDTGARPVLEAYPGLVVEVPCAGDPSDVDTTEDLAEWIRRQRLGSDRSGH